MAYNATVCKVMIASPGDVEKERGIARVVIWNWNYQHSESTRFVLMPVGWDTHSAPATGDRPQAIINKQVLKGCDLLIGIFWTRLGTPTGQEESGTVEEIKEHVGNGKPAMLYFSSAPIPPDKLEAPQYERLKAFKKQRKSDSLIASYERPAEFKDLLTRHLIKTINDNEYFKRIRSESAASVVLETAVEAVTEPQLSGEARDLLLEAVKESSGSILRITSSGGLTIQANNENMVSAPMDGRCQAVWQGALDELVENDLIADVGYKGEVFRVTRRGYELADLLKGAE